MHVRNIQTNGILKIICKLREQCAFFLILIIIESHHTKIEGIPHPASSVNNRLYYDLSTSLTKIEKQSLLIDY